MGLRWNQKITFSTFLSKKRHFLVFLTKNEYHHRFLQKILAYLKKKLWFLVEKTPCTDQKWSKVQVIKIVFSKSSSKNGRFLLSWSKNWYFHRFPQKILNNLKKKKLFFSSKKRSKKTKNHPKTAFFGIFHFWAKLIKWPKNASRFNFIRKRISPSDSSGNFGLGTFFKNIFSQF